MRQTNHPLDHDTQCLEAIALLKFHRRQDYNNAKRYFIRVNKVAVRAAIIAFIVMSYFLHALLLGGNVDIVIHALAFSVNSIITILTFVLIREFHPSRTISENYLLSSQEHERQITILKEELKRPKTNISDSICYQQRKKSVSTALTHADNLIHS